jgi:phosphoribosyl 1,2-cyclic phosphodiesterase
VRVKFWGVRGSIPTPLTPEEIRKKIRWAVKRSVEEGLSSDDAIDRFVDKLPQHVGATYGGNTPCVELDVDGHTIIFDAGSGLKALGSRLTEGVFGKGEGTCHLFLSHTHWDHIQGFPFFLPAFVPGNRILVYSSEPDMRQRLSHQQDDRFFPVPLDAMKARLDFVSLGEGETVRISDIQVSNMSLNHPGGALGYRAQQGDKAVVYASDTEFMSPDRSETERYVSFFSQAKVLIFDSQYTLVEAFQKEDWGHSSSLKGVDLAAEAGVDTLVLFHHEPTYDDETLWNITQRTATYAKMQGTKDSPKIIMAYEDLELVL